MDDLIHPTALSPYIRFGCLSVRYFLLKMREMLRADASYEPLFKEVTSKLLQREFYFTVLAQVREGGGREGKEGGEGREGGREGREGRREGREGRGEREGGGE